tara:strand:- start:376 stop:537 length:162 start_codon:yes stop_codon:yes gene_type:complete
VNEILEQIEFLKNLSSELTMVSIKLARVNELVVRKADEAVKEIRKFEKEVKDD